MTTSAIETICSWTHTPELSLAPCKTIYELFQAVHLVSRVSPLFSQSIDVVDWSSTLEQDHKVAFLYIQAIQTYDKTKISTKNPRATC